MREPRVALVTGANRGIGLAVCRQLASLRYRVILSGRDPVTVEAAARSLGSDVHPMALDVTNADSIARAAAEIHKRFGRVDVLVNNAAVLIGENSDPLSLSLDVFRETFDTNVLGIVAVSQAFVPGMVRRRYGRVVNVSSRAGQLSTMSDYAPAYSVSKAAVNAFTRQLAASTRGAAVLVNSACPGWVRTKMGGRKRSALGRRGRGHDRLAGHPARFRPDRRVLQRPPADRVVTPTRRARSRSNDANVNPKRSTAWSID